MNGSQRNRPHLKRGPKNTTKQAETMRRVRQVEIELRAQHSINGQTYGPGRIKVRKDVAAVLLEQERRAQEHEDIFYGKRAYIVGPGLRPIQVPYDSFDAALTAAIPFGTASSSGFQGG